MPINVFVLRLCLWHMYITFNAVQLCVTISVCSISCEPDTKLSTCCSPCDPSPCPVLAVRQDDSPTHEHYWGHYRNSQQFTTHILAPPTQNWLKYISRWRLPAWITSAWTRRRQYLSCQAWSWTYSPSLLLFGTQ